ncbi:MULTISPECIES: ATP-binding protein [Paenibacillus]|uniref:ATP-binding protein n=1 Tax=Paenibacillus TaxID=44249 RepID=UPI00036B3DDF|nr:MULTISPECIES: ATP-binding protein [Paenibacillus]
MKNVEKLVERQQELEMELQQLRLELGECQQARADAQKVAEDKSNFIAMLSHEIRTPMNGILSMAELLYKTELDEEQNSYVQILQTSSNSLMALVNNLLDIGKMEAGKMKLNKDPFDVINTIEDLTYALAPRAFEKGVGVHLNVHSDIPLFVIGDVLKVRQIIMNLLQNAIKFTNTGDIKVSLFMLPPMVKGKLTVKIAIEDTGIGMSTEQLKHIFEVYSQLHSDQEHVYGGTGLGLSISKHLVELMGGEIRLESMHGVGTEVSVILDFEEYTDLPSIPFQEDILQGIRILLLDSNAESVGIISDMLTEWGAKVTTSSSMDERFFDEMYHHAYDLTLVDLTMIDRERWLQDRAKIQNQCVFLLAPLGEKVEGDFRDTFDTIITKPVRKIHILNSILALQQSQR